MVWAENCCSHTVATRRIRINNPEGLTPCEISKTSFPRLAVRQTQSRTFVHQKDTLNDSISDSNYYLDSTGSVASSFLKPRFCGLGFSQIAHLLFDMFPKIRAGSWIQVPESRDLDLIPES